VEPSSDDGPRGWLSSPIWAQGSNVEGNTIKQLLVPRSRFPLIQERDGRLLIANLYGSWPAFSVGDTLPDDQLVAQVPLGSASGDELTRAAWVGPRLVSSPAEVLMTYPNAVRFETSAGQDGEGLRAPQRGGVHAALAYWTTGRLEPGTIVMPTGTGKTETMIALLVAAQPSLVLVLVPSDALREQIAAKFERLGILQELGIIDPSAARPVVGRLLHRISSPESAEQFAEMCNVIVATPNVLMSTSDEVREALLNRCSHLFIDEAHHVAASTWGAIRDAFADRPVLQFTATPFREDGHRIAGRQIYAFPLRLAQARGYFSRINYTSIIDFDDLDRSVATAAVKQLREDIEAGRDHILMARVDSIRRTADILPIYEALAPELKPLVLSSATSARSRKAALKDIGERVSRIIICVNMLGEGFDLSALKVAAIHDPKKSLAVTLQFIGRFTRTSDSATLGEASAFVARKDVASDKRLRLLYAEDSDWNAVIRDLSESAVEEQQEISDFETGFTSRPEEVDVRNLLPKMSTVVYRTPSESWDPMAITEYFGEENLLTLPIGLNAEAGVAWCVVEHRNDVRWGEVRTVEEVVYELFILYFDQDRHLLYINSSENSGVFQELAVAVCGDGVWRFVGSTVYRVMGDISRLTPTNVGVLDIHSQFRRFSMHVGSDVSEGFSVAEASTKTQTNISGNGYRDGERINISASIKGRIWTHASASSLRHWCDWCDVVGTKLLDDSISIEDVIGNFLLPQEIDERPDAVLLGIEWPWQILIGGPERFMLQPANGGPPFPLVDVEVVPADTERTGPLRFTFRSEAWSTPYQAEYIDSTVKFRCEVAQELEVVTARSRQRLSAWLDDQGLTFLLEKDQLIDQHGLLFSSDPHRAPYPRDRLQPIDWEGTDLHVESQGPERRSDSIQARAFASLTAQDEWDIVLDDDGNGEVADLVALRLDDKGLLIKFVHCKFAHGDSPGARVADLYEVCGQASKSVAWRRSDMEPFFRYLGHRARKKQNRTGVSPFLVGDERAFIRLQDMAQIGKRRLEMVIAQPGLSAQTASDAQLELLASTEAYLRNTVNAPLAVWCSA
jgi:superfamily II DNA or RNA helicase